MSSPVQSQPQGGTVQALAGRPAAQPIQARHERKAGGYHLHPHRPQIARHEYPRGHR